MSQILAKADDKALGSINNNMTEFIELFKELTGEAGCKWDDMIVNHEWNVANKQLKASFGKDVADIERVSESHRFLFSADAVRAW